jgi:antitoxin FitA
MPSVRQFRSNRLYRWRPQEASGIVFESSTTRTQTSRTDRAQPIRPHDEPFRAHVAGPVRTRYHAPMRVAIELTEAQADELRARAKRLGLAPEELASAAVAELLSEPESDFEQAARNVLSKNAELYRRLAR